MKKKTLFSYLFIFLSITLSQAQVPQSERDALIALYNATDGPNWTNNTNWNTSYPVSSWYGVTVGNMNGQDHVTHISLSQKQLSGMLPPEIGDFPELRYLNLSKNNLTGSIPPEFGNLIELEILELRNNNFSGSLPASLTNLNNLTFFYILYNHFSGLFPDVS